MPQYDFGTINTATTTGGDLALLLQNWRDAVLSNHSGSTRPAYVKAGQIWVNTSTSTNWVVNVYDGVADIPLGYVNTTDDTANFLQRADVTTKNASATIVVGERNMTVGVTASTAALTMTLPAATVAKNGFRIVFQKRDNTAFSVTIARSGSDLINSGTTYVLTQQYDTVELVCDGASNWYAYGGVLDLGIGTAKLADLAVTTAKIADSAVTTAKIAALNVTTGTIADSAVTNAKLGSLAVGTAKIADLAVTTAKIADSAVTAAKLASGQTGAAPIYAVRSWVNFTGTGTPTVAAGGNVSSITDNGVGDYTVNMTTAMADVNYAVAATAFAGAGVFYLDVRGDTTTLTTTAYRLVTHVQNSGNPFRYDPNNLHAVVMR